jgi:hypothetical protein
LTLLYSIGYFLCNSYHHVSRFLILSLYYEHACIALICVLQIIQSINQSIIRLFIHISQSVCPPVIYLYIHSFIFFFFSNLYKCIILFVIKKKFSLCKFCYFKVTLSRCMACIQFSYRIDWPSVLHAFLLFVDFANAQSTFIALKMFVILGLILLCSQRVAS